MSSATRSPFKPIVLQRGREDLKEVMDEILLDFQAPEASDSLASTSYSVAVRECSQMAEGGPYLLKVNPDLRTLLMSQFTRMCSALRIYRFSDQPKTRMVLTGKMHVRIASYCPAEERQSILTNYFSQDESEESLGQGLYTLNEEHAKNPLRAWKALEQETLVVNASPILLVLSIPESEWTKVDLELSP